MKKLISTLSLLALVCLSTTLVLAQQSTTGLASYYNEFYNGRLTTTEEVYDSGLLTAASEKYDLGTYLKVTNPKSGKSVIVRMNDRCRCNLYGRLIDLSRKAAADLDILRNGMGEVSVEPVPTWLQEQLTRDFIAQNGAKYPKLMKRLAEKESGYYLTASSESRDYRPAESTWKKLSTGNWGVQVSALTDIENANGVKDALVKAGISDKSGIYIIVSQKNNKPLYRVVVGKFGNMEAARNEVKRLDNLGYPGVLQEHI
jgi:rare lipoprotein A